MACDADHPGEFGSDWDFSATERLWRNPWRWVQSIVNSPEHIASKGAPPIHRCTNREEIHQDKQREDILTNQVLASFARVGAWMDVLATPVKTDPIATEPGAMWTLLKWKKRTHTMISGGLVITVYLHKMTLCTGGLTRMICTIPA